jgi:hypothetical protein
MKVPRISSELAEEKGWHIGDGTMNFYKGKGSYALRGHIQDDKKHYQQRIKPLYKEIYNLDVSLRDMPSTSCYGFQKWSNELVSFKYKKLSLPLGPKLNLEMPSILVRKYAKDIIRGIFDTDGNLYLEKKNKGLYPRIDIANTCLNLLLKINKTLYKIGLRSTVYTEKRKQENWKDLHRLNVRGEKMLVKWFKIINPQNPKHMQKCQFYLDNS